MGWTKDYLSEWTLSNFLGTVTGHQNFKAFEKKSAFLGYY
jgi:hypothetical protein